MKQNITTQFLAQTRSNTEANATFIDAMLAPNAAHGGLYTFSSLAKIPNITHLYTLSYTEICKAIFQHLGLGLDSALLESALQSYTSFRAKEIAPLIQIEPHLYSLELYHGPTYAFKDMALQPFSKLLAAIAKKRGENYLILSATSGDTGPATLSGFANAENIKAICIYPKGGTSDVQRLQMTTQDAQNLKVYGITGDFDLAQSTLKSLLNSKDFRDCVADSGYKLSAANSVNIARIAFQIVYYFIIGKELAKQNIHEYSVIVPSGNFGNALGAFFAKRLGLPIKKICIASNPNDILTQFFTTGIYDIRDKKLQLSYSPAMDILKSSNIERLLFAYFGAEKTKKYMESLDSTKYFAVTKEELQSLQELFEARSFSDMECVQGIQESFAKGYVLDPHTSNAYLFAQYRKKQNHPEAQVIIATAHFAKFANVVCKALCNIDSQTLQTLTDKEALDRIFARIEENKMQHNHNTLQGNLALDLGILNLFDKKEIHTQTYNATDLQDSILAWLKE